MEQIGQAVLRAYFLTPWEREPDRDAVRRAWQVYLDRKAADGWRLVRVVREYVTPTPVIDDTGGVMREHIIEMLMERPARRVRFEVPDRLVPKILAVRPDAKVN